MCGGGWGGEGVGGWVGGCVHALCIMGFTNTLHEQIAFEMHKRRGAWAVLI